MFGSKESGNQNLAPELPQGASATIARAQSLEPAQPLVTSAALKRETLQQERSEEIVKPALKPSELAAGLKKLREEISDFDEKVVKTAESVERSARRDLSKTERALYDAKESGVTDHIADAIAGNSASLASLRTAQGKKVEDLTARADAVFARSQRASKLAGESEKLLASVSASGGSGESQEKLRLISEKIETARAQLDAEKDMQRRTEEAALTAIKEVKGPNLRTINAALYTAQAVQTTAKVGARAVGGALGGSPGAAAAGFFVDSASNVGQLVGGLDSGTVAPEDALRTLGRNTRDATIDAAISLVTAGAGGAAGSAARAAGGSMLRQAAVAAGVGGGVGVLSEGVRSGIEALSARADIRADLKRQDSSLAGKALDDAVAFEFRSQARDLSLDGTGLLKRFAGAFLSGAAGGGAQPYAEAAKKANLALREAVVNQSSHVAGSLAESGVRGNTSVDQLALSLVASSAARGVAGRVKANSVRVSSAASDAHEHSEVSPRSKPSSRASGPDHKPESHAAGADHDSGSASPGPSRKLTVSDLTHGDHGEVQTSAQAQVAQQREFTARIKAVFSASEQQQDPEAKRETLRAGLRELVFDPETGKTKSDLSSTQLTELFHRFREAGLPADQVHLFESSKDPSFRNSPAILEFAALAYKRIDNVERALEISEGLVKDGKATGFTWNLLGDAYTQRQRAAEDMLEVARGRDSIFTPEQVSAAQQRFRKQFGYTPDAADVTGISAVAREVRQQAHDSFAEGFQISPSTHAGLGLYRRTLENLADVTERIGAAKGPQLDNLRAEQSRLTRLKEELPALLTQVHALEGGADSTDYWHHAAAAELAVIHGGGPGEVGAHLQRAAATAPAPWTLDMTRRRLEAIGGSQKAMSGFASEGVDHGIDSLRESADRLRRGQRAEFPRAASNSDEDRLMNSTFSGRGLVGGVLPVKIEGGFSTAGTRVPDITFSRADAAVMSRLLDRWGLSAEQDPRQFVRRFGQKLHDIFGTEGLQDLESQPHRDSDARSKALYQLLGHSEDKARRANAETTTSASAAALTGIGDCREHAALTVGAFAVWQGNKAQKLIREAYAGIERGDQRSADIVGDKLPELLSHDLRAGAVGVFMPAKVRGTYELERSADGKVQERRYSLGENLSDYELKTSQLLVTYEDGTTRRIEPQKGSGLKHTDGVPLIPDSDRVASVQLYNYVESHTMTFLTRRDPLSGVRDVQRADTFYANFKGSYQFADGAVRQGVVPGLFSGGFHEAVTSDGRRTQIPVLLAPNERSSRQRAVTRNYSEPQDGLRLYGRELDASAAEVADGIYSGQARTALAEALAAHSSN